AGVSDTNAHSLEFIGAQVCNRVSQTIMPAVSAAFFQFSGAGGAVELIVCDENLTGRDLEKVCKCFYRLATAVHKRGRIQQVQLNTLPLNASIVPVVLFFGA